MSFVSWTHRCTECAYEDVELHDRADVRDLLNCPECGAEQTWRRLPFGASVSTAKTSQTRPAGTSNSGVKKDLKERLALRKEYRRLRNEGRYGDAVSAKRESEKVVGRK